MSKIQFCYLKFFTMIAKPEISAQIIHPRMKLTFSYDFYLMNNFLCKTREERKGFSLFLYRRKEFRLINTFPRILNIFSQLSFFSLSHLIPPLYIFCLLTLIYFFKFNSENMSHKLKMSFTMNVNNR